MKTRIMFLISVLVWAGVSFLPSCKDTIVPPDRIIDTTGRGPDTTSHDFVWTIDSLGEGNSLLNDVAIVNDTLIYAVGEIFRKDSIGQIDPNSYSIAKWDGMQWEVRRLYDVSNQLLPALRGICAFSASEIWLADGGVHRWDGTSQKVFASYDRIDLIGGTENGQSVDKLWGTGSDNFYGVGRKGMIAHFNGATWTRIGSGTSVDIQDVWGQTTMGEDTILALASNRAGLPQGLDMIRILGLLTSHTSTTGLPMDLSAVWFSESSNYFVAGDGLYNSNSLAGSWVRDSTWPSTYIDAIRGVDRKDVVVAGAFGLLSHYNGSTWKHFQGIEVPAFFGRYKRVAIKNGMIVAVGWKDDKAIVARGRR